MAAVLAYWRPATLAEALALLCKPGCVPVGGGTKVNAGPASAPVEIVDLQALGLDQIAPLSGAVSVGACATLQQVAEHAAVPPVVRAAARREAPSTLRSAATIGGCIATGHWESELLAALLACGCVVTLAGIEGEQTASLDELLSDRAMLQGRIISGVVVAAEGIACSARTGRTAADEPIVAAVARREAGCVWLALSGVAARPVLCLVGPSTAKWLDLLDPPGDFRGSATYRRALGGTLARRVLEAIE